MDLYEEISPAHYREAIAANFEPIDLIENFPATVGNAIKYLARAGRKQGAPASVDIRKARWYIFRILKTHALPVKRSFCVATDVPIDEIVKAFSEKNAFLKALFGDWSTEKAITKKAIADTLELIDATIDRVDIEGKDVKDDMEV